jgi:hypothetical protein
MQAAKVGLNAAFGDVAGCMKHWPDMDLYQPESKTGHQGHLSNLNVRIMLLQTHRHQLVGVKVAHHTCPMGRGSAGRNVCAAWLCRCC